jgi:hypothetical protein
MKVSLRYAAWVLVISAFNAGSCAKVRSDDQASTLRSTSDHLFTESYQFISFGEDDLYAALSLKPDSLERKFDSVNGQWLKVDAKHVKLTQDSNGSSETILIRRTEDLSKIFGRTLVTKRKEKISDEGPLSFRSITLSQDGTFKAQSFVGGAEVKGDYDLGFKPVYDRESTNSAFEHVLISAIAFNIAGVLNPMSFTVSKNGELTLEDPMAHGDYPIYR